MHVLMTVNSAWNIWNFRRAVVKALIADGHRLTILAPFDDAVTSLEELGCRVVHLDMSVKGLNPLEDLRLVWRFRRIFRAEKPDAVLSYTIKNNIFGALAARPLGLPFLPNVTGLGTAFLSGGFLQGIAERLYRRAFSGLPVIFFQNEDDRNAFLAHRLIHPDQARLLPGSGIDLKHFSPVAYPEAGKRPVFLMIARLLRDKGVVEFVDAARMVKALRPEVRFQLLGAVAAENRSAIDTATLQSWVSDGIVEYLGTTSDVRPAIAKSDCVVLPSYREGAPRTLLEAAAMARPIIATDVPGCRAVVERGVTGFLCAPKDPWSLADIIHTFLDLPISMRASMGYAGRSRVERLYDQEIIVSEVRSALAASTGQAMIELKVPK